MNFLREKCVSNSTQPLKNYFWTFRKLEFFSNLLLLNDDPNNCLGLLRNVTSEASVNFLLPASQVPTSQSPVIAFITCCASQRTPARCKGLCGREQA